MDEFEDTMLERLLSGGAPLDVDGAYGQVTRRVRQVRRRRVMVAGTAACVVLFAGGAVALNRTDPAAPSLQPAGSFDSPVDGSDDSSSVATTDTTGTSSTEGSTATTDDAAGSTPTTDGAAGTPTTATSSTTATSGTTPTSTAGTPTSPPTTAPPAPQNATYGGIGGSVTVRLANGALSLQGTSAASGYSTEIKQNRADRVEVIFTDGDHETKIRVDLVNGSMVPRVDEQ